MSKNPRTPLPPTARDALEVLQGPISAMGSDGCPRPEARQLLIDDEFTDTHAEQALHQLLMRGYLYEVEDHLFVTP